MGREEKEKKEKGGYGERLREITAVLKKHAITRGVSPEKLRLILEDLGPTYIKLGQIMSLRSDILPKRYCDELMKLCSDVPPMPFSQVIEVLEESMGCPWQAEFQHIEQKPLGAASIAQVHRATLKTGDEVVIKVQRKGIYETMARDIGLMHKAVRLMPPEDFPFDQVPGGRNYHWRDGHKKVYFYYYKDWIIWGLTAYVLRGVARTLKTELPAPDCENLVV